MKKAIYASLSCLALTVLVSLSACKPTTSEEVTPVADPVCNLGVNKKNGTKSFEVSYNAQHQPTKFTYYDAAGSVQSSYDFAYDTNARVSMQTGKDAVGVTTGRVEITYGANGKVFQTINYNTAGEVTTKTTFEYDGDGRIIRISDSLTTAGYPNPTGYSVVEYSGSSKYPTRTIYTPQPAGTRTITTFAYDANGNMTERVRFDAPIGGQAIQRYRNLYTYDTQKLLAISLPGYARAGYYSGLNDNFFSDKNNRTLITEINYDAAGVETSRYVNNYVYEYGSNGYPTKSTYTPSSGASVVNTYEYHCH